ncbi:MAG: hypothetical protein ACLP7P_11280 [Rhodomicrobium sp.]
MEDAIIRAKANTRGHAGSSGLGDTAGSRRDGTYERRFGDTLKSTPVFTQNRTGQSAQGAPKKPVAAVANAFGPLVNEILSSPAPKIAALPANEDEDRSGRRLAARFVRNAQGRPAEIQPRRSMAALRPYLAGAAFLIILAAGLTGYFFKSEASTGWSPAGSAYAAAVSGDPSGAAAIRQEPDTASPVPAGADSWPAAVETFRLLAAQAAAQQVKAAKSENERLLERLAAWRSASAAR